MMCILQKLFTHLCSFIGFVYGEVCSAPLIGNLRKVKFFSRRRDCIELGSGSLTQARIIAAGRERRAESGEALPGSYRPGPGKRRSDAAGESWIPPPPANPAISSSKKDSAWLSENNITDNFQHLVLNKHPTDDGLVYLKPDHFISISSVSMRSFETWTLLFVSSSQEKVDIICPEFRHLRPRGRKFGRDKYKEKETDNFIWIPSRRRRERQSGIFCA